MTFGSAVRPTQRTLLQVDLPIPIMSKSLNLWLNIDQCKMTSSTVATQSILKSAFSLRVSEDDALITKKHR